MISLKDKSKHFWQLCVVLLILVNILLLTFFTSMLIDKKIISNGILSSHDEEVYYYLFDDLNSSSIGNPNANVTITIYNDFESPFCKKFYKQTFQKIKEDYVDTGKVRFVFKHFPQTNIHKSALLEAEAFECANDQNKSIEISSKLYSTKRATPQEILDLAVNIGLNVDLFQECLDKQKYKTKILTDQQEGLFLGITQTPSLVINDEIIEGVEPYFVLKKIINEKLRI